MSDQKSHIENCLLNSFKAFVGSHFLLNCINAIQSDVILNNHKSAFDLLQRFNKLYKSALRFSNDQFTSLTDETDFIQNYLALEHIRFPNQTASRVKTDVQNSEANVPTFILQSFIENAWLLALEINKSKMVVSIKTNNLDEVTCDISVEPKPHANFHSKVKTKTELALYRLDMLKEYHLLDYDISWNVDSFFRITLKLH